MVEKLQFREEGVALRYLEINGVWEDHVRYAITAEEWEAAPRRARPPTGSPEPNAYGCFFEILAWRAAMRSANQGWPALHTWGSSSRSTAAGWSPTVRHVPQGLLRDDAQLRAAHPRPGPPSPARLARSASSSTQR